MSKAAKMVAAAAAAAAAKKTTTVKTTSKTVANYLSTVASVRPVSKSYGLGTNNKFAVSYDTKGTTNFVLVSFGGYLAMLSGNGFTLRWSRPINSFLFSMEHLCSIIGSKYLESNIQVRLFNKVMQAFVKDKIKTRERELPGETPGDPPLEEVHGHIRIYGNALQGTVPAQAHYQWQGAPAPPVPHDCGGEGPAGR
jgi:hypothetical protein